MNTVVLDRPTIDTRMENTEPKTHTLSDEIIPAVPGEYYAYLSEFSDKKPVYALLKCKSNKNRLKVDLLNLGNEANILFLFDLDKGVKACSVVDASDFGIINGSVKSGICDDTLISETNISPEEFYRIYAERDAQLLAKVCKKAHRKSTAFVSLKPNMVVSVITTGGKYGLFLVKNVDRISIKIDACHVLLQE